MVALQACSSCAAATSRTSCASCIVKGKEAQTTNIQTYSHHTLLAYIGYRIWRDHPVVGAGWEASTDPDVVDPQLPAARRKFPDVAPLAFPTRAHEWGVQNAYVQAAAPTSG